MLKDRAGLPLCLPLSESDRTMLILRLAFPWGRYYAHPWGLNPARLRDPEWPPSPWRLLRALAAGWFRAHPGQGPTPALLVLLEILGHELPEIAVGPAAFSQTTHWQPNFGSTDKDEQMAATYKRTRHENHFAATETPVLFRWMGIALDEHQRSMLDAILPHVSYFGRSESLCSLTLKGEDPSGTDVGWCKPCTDERTNAPIRRIAEDCRDVFCPDTADFKAADLWSRRADRDGPGMQSAPPHLVEALLHHQPLPDGARWISYLMPEGWPGRWVVRVPKAERRKKMTGQLPRVARYLRFSLHCRVPIPLKFTVSLAEEFRAAAISHFFRASGASASTFALSGHERPLDVTGEHQHAFYLPLGSDACRPDALNDLHVWCPYGLTQAEVEALMRVQRLDWGGGRYPTRPVLIAISNDVPEDCPISTGQIASRIWRSRTPFVPPRYFYRGNLQRGKLRAKETPEQQLAQCLRRAGINTQGHIHRLVPAGTTQHSLPPVCDWDIVRVPEGEDDRLVDGIVTDTHVPVSSRAEKARRIGLLFELVFDAPVTLSVPALGHSSHFGLGLFVPAPGAV